MSMSGRGQARQRTLRRAGLIAGALVLLALLFLISGHWILGIIFGIAAVAGVWVFLQLRSVR
jgi:hypothetical protein